MIPVKMKAVTIMKVGVDSEKKRSSKRCEVDEKAAAPKRPKTNFNKSP
jgi:hypothetical protein